jgi:raffinose/stachyose/melibiose transport system substrate-binding protein
MSVLAVLCAVAGLLMLTGCDLFPGIRGAGDEEITLSALCYVDTNNSRSVSMWNDLRQAFEAANPGVRLEPEYLYGAAYHNALSTRANAGTLPDVFTAWPGYRTSYINGLDGSTPRAKNLRPLVGSHETEFHPLAMRSQGRNGELFELPDGVVASHVLYANQALLTQLGLTIRTTLAELNAQVMTIVGTDRVPVAIANQDGWPVQSCLLSTLVERTAGQTWFTNAIDNRDYVARFTDQVFVDALTILRDLADWGVLPPNVNELAYDENDGGAAGMFSRGESVYMIDGSWRIGYFADKTAEWKNQIILTTFPDVPNQMGVSGSSSMVAGTGFAMNANVAEEEADAAWGWIWYFSGPDGSAIRARYGIAPAYELNSTGLSLDPLMVKLIEFLHERPYGWIMDDQLGGMGGAETSTDGTLHPGIKALLALTKTPQEVAEEYETWIAANEPWRRD